MLAIDGNGGAGLEREVAALICKVPADAVVKLRVRGHVPEAVLKVLSAPRLRENPLSTMNIGLGLDWTRSHRRP